MMDYELTEIPKIIHYCWFGNNQLSELALKCIGSWKKFFPDYRIIEWNENNFDINQCQYVKEAYAANKWAHVSDYVRFYVLYKYGGIYFDTDVEVIKPFDKIIERGPFMGNENTFLSIAPGLCIGCYKNHPIIGEILSDYERSSFYNKNGELDLFNTVVVRTTKIFKQFGLAETGEIQTVGDFTIYPKDYFCPINFETMKINKTANTLSIHWYDASWFSDDDKKIHQVEVRIRRKFGKFISYILCFIYRKSFRLYKFILKKWRETK